MGGDISDGAKIGIGLVLLVAIVAIVMALLKMIKNQANNGSTALQDSFDKVSESEFDGYDNVEKTGTDVMAAVKIFQDRQVAILVHTTKTDANKCYNYGTLIKGATAEADGGNGVGAVYEVNIATTEATDAAAGAITKYKNHVGYIADLDIATDGSYNINANYVPLEKKSTKYFVRTSGRFLSELVFDNTGAKIGILFTQTK